MGRPAAQASAHGGPQACIPTAGGIHSLSGVSVVVDAGSGEEERARLPIFSVAGGQGAAALARVLSTSGTPSPATGPGAQRAYSFPGLGTLPPKLAKRIADREFIDMRELLPEAWRVDTPMAGNSQSKPLPRGPITDFKLWAECYATLAGVLVSVYPEKAPHLMAYLRLIAKASRNYEDKAWVAYDTAFRRQAANLNSLDWGTIDPVMYNETFSGKAKPISRCSFCVVDTHSREECAYAPKGWSPQESSSSEPRASRAAFRPPSRTGARSETGHMGRDSVEICWLYNHVEGSRCSFPNCRYAHLCAKCHCPHPASECGRSTGTRPRSPRPPPFGDRKPRR